ncbi:hypothetical protein DSO57_1031807 [Entomophthora muscae]|uniref:Uncharacterized protein n=2 Tax=Entomophthora muscae TaxID=34485 RepID=A0ACC2TBM5_9FUNG|nr:hypothetical protein DSO57_1031807 [Entomophthora muscae]
MNYEPQAELIEHILNEEDCYRILGIQRDATVDQVRRAYIQKSRICHPDKFPGSPKATQAFQKLSTSYETLRKPSTKMAYDFSGERTQSSDCRTSFIGAFSQLYREFLDGDFENILTMIDFINRQNPEFTFDRASASELLMELRDLCIVSWKYIDVAKEEVSHLFDIQTELCALSYFNVLGRMKLTLKLSRVFVSIPVTMHSLVNERQLISPHLAGALQNVASIMEKAEGSLEVVTDWISTSALGSRIGSLSIPVF